MVKENESGGEKKKEKEMPSKWLMRGVPKKNY